MCFVENCDWIDLLINELNRKQRLKWHCDTKAIYFIRCVCCHRHCDWGFTIFCSSVCVWHRGARFIDLRIISHSIFPLNFILCQTIWRRKMVLNMQLCLIADSGEQHTSLTHLWWTTKMPKKTFINNFYWAVFFSLSVESRNNHNKLNGKCVTVADTGHRRIRVETIYGWTK